jgi:hypothetical protein
MNFESHVQFTDLCVPVKVAEPGSAGAVGRTNRLLAFEFNSIFAYCGASISYITVLIIIIIIIIALQPFIGPWSLFQFLDPTHSR